MTHPQTIQIFLPDGDPQGIRIASITTRIVQLIEIPRLRLADFLSMSEANHVGIYFLLGEDEGTGSIKAYIGQTGSLGTRLKQHHDSKDFWNRALIALSLTHSLTVTHAHYLEWLAINRAGQAGRFKLANGTAGTRPHTPPAMEAECREIFETINILLTTLGHPVFEALVAPSGAATSNDENTQATHSQPQKTANKSVFLRNKKADAQGIYSETGFVVLKGSWGNTHVSQQSLTLSTQKKRQDLIDSGDLKVVGHRLHFEKDVMFNSPSSAGSMVNGRSTNGWTEWKDSTGSTLSEIMGRDMSKPTSP
ncbi:GIY-YIG nuclease family protein [Asaia spathodeae]|uniref:GIY-YIG nuclease family protein n=1 Tax=Asaia spathodeae TaxID=657016 RepID=UPI002FC3D9C1